MPKNELTGKSYPARRKRNRPRLPSSKWKLLFALAVAMLMFVLLIVQLFTVSILRGEYWTKKAMAQWARTTYLKADRGKITDRDGTVLVDVGENFLEESRLNHNKLGNGRKVLKYKDMKMFDRIRARRNGIIIHREGNRYMAYLFAAMYSVEWYYIEKLDLEIFLAENGVDIPAGVAPNDGR